MKSAAGRICAGDWKPTAAAFAFFHPALPGQPIIFIEVALTKGISAAVQPLLDLDSPVTNPEVRGHGDVLLDHQLSGRAARHSVRQFAHQAGWRKSSGRSSRASRQFRHLVAGSRLRRLASPRSKTRSRSTRRRTGRGRIAQVAGGRRMVQTQA